MSTQLILSLALVAPAPALKPAPKPVEHNPFVGVWSLETWMFNGAYIPNAARTVEFAADGTLRSSKDGRHLGGGTYTVVPKGDPAEVDWADEGAAAQKGIYKAEGGTLTICLQNDPKGSRPAGFAAGPGSNCNLLTFKRVEKKD